jgi:hypothetical protein
MHIAPPYIAVGDNWYRIDDQASLNYLDVMVKVIERGNYYDLSGEDSD